MSSARSRDYQLELEDRSASIDVECWTVFDGHKVGSTDRLVGPDALVLRKRFSERHKSRAS